MDSSNLHQITQITTPSDVIDFGIGQPDFALLPAELLRQAADYCLTQADPAILQYGAEAGNGRFRQSLARFLTEGYRIPVAPEQLFVTNGASQALDLICTLITRPGDLIFVEEPSYFLALQIFADHGLQVVSIPTDEEGLIPESLAEQLTRRRPVFLYTIPTFHNPTGSTIPADRRQEIAALSQAHDFLIVADEVYQLLPYTAVPPLPFAQFNADENIMSLGSFSKILAPGLRLGWIQTAPKSLQPFIDCGLTQSGGGFNPFTSAIVRSLIDQGWQSDHLARLKQAYGQRADVMATTLRAELGGICDFQAATGGFFIWLTLPKGMDANHLLSIARSFKVGFQPGVKFSSRQGQSQRLRLSFSFYDDDTIQEGVRRLKAAIHAYGQK